MIERDYSFGSLPIFRRGPDGSSPELYNVIKVEGFTPGTWANTANDYSFDYVDRDNNYLKATRYVQDIANKMLTGRTRSLSQSLEGVSNGATAALVGTRELRAGSYPRPPINLSVNRDGYTLEPGDVIRYIDNVDNFQKVLRVAEVQALATDSTAEIQLNCTEDQYGVGASAFAAYVSPGFTLTLHLHFEVEDSLSELDDLLAKSLAVASTAAVTDTISLSDAISVQLNSPRTLSVSDSINNFADAVVAQSGFLPTDIAGLDLWLNGDNATLSGVPEFDWPSSVGGFNYGQNTSARQPSFATVNGHQVVQFGTNKCLEIDGSTFSYSTANTLICVCSKSSAAEYIIRGGPGNSGEGGPAFISRFNPGTGAKDFEYFFQSGAHERATIAASTNTSLHILAITRTDDTGNYVGYFDDPGTPVFTNAVNTADDWNTRALSRIGAFTAGTSAYDGQIGDILHWPSVLNGTDLTSVFNYLKTKYGIP